MHQAPQPPHDGLRPRLRNPAAGSASAPARPGPQRPPLALHAGRSSSARVKGKARAFLSKDRDARAGRRPGGGLAQAGPSDVELEAARNLQVRDHSRQALPSHLGTGGSPRLPWLSFDGLPGLCLTQLFSRIPESLLTPGRDSPQWYSKARTDFCHSVGNKLASPGPIIFEAEQSSSRKVTWKVGRSLQG